MQAGSVITFKKIAPNFLIFMLYFPPFIRGISPAVSYAQFRVLPPEIRRSSSVVLPPYHLLAGAIPDLDAVAASTVSQHPDSKDALPRHKLIFRFDAYTSYASFVQNNTVPERIAGVEQKKIGLKGRAKEHRAKKSHDYTRGHNSDFSRTNYQESGSNQGKYARGKMFPHDKSFELSESHINHPGASFAAII